MSVISLKKLVVESLQEHAEQMLGVSWTDQECLGPFIIFRDNARKLHHILGNKNDDKLYLDGEETHNPQGRVETHGNLRVAVTTGFDIDPTQSVAIHGRIWQFISTTYVATWQDVKQLKTFGMKDFMSELKNLLSNELNVNIQDVKFNPYTNEEDKDDPDTPLWSYDEFLKLSGSETDLEKQDRQRQIHLMDPTVKGQMMKLAGIRPKSAGNVPDFQKRQLAGIDEKRYE
jgi:hypothetical protein